MRYIDSVLKARIEKAHQTLYENANPAMNIWISRHSTPITDEIFWEQTKIGDYASVEAVSIAARRSDIRRQTDRIYAGFCDDRVGIIKYAMQTADLNKMTWVNVETINDAVDIALAFDGKMVKTIKGYIEFKTDNSPWVFWVTAAGELYTKLLGNDPTQIQLTTTNCTKVTAIRGMYSDVADFDQGLLVFFLLNGTIYLRSYRGGVWEDAAPINFGPAVTWTDIAAGRTWDYRIVLQCIDTSGNIYELFTFSEGIAKQNVERIEITKITAAGESIPVQYIDTAEDERIEIQDINAAGQVIYGLSPVPVSCENIDDGTGDWGKYIEVQFDYPITGIASNEGHFIIIDDNDVSYTAQTIEYVDDGTNTKIVLGFIDFNGAYQTQCNLTYALGSIQGPAASLAVFGFSFMPENLISRVPGIPIVTTNSSDIVIIIVFDRAISCTDFTVLKNALAITSQEYNYTPDGILQAKNYIIDETDEVWTINEMVNLSVGILTDLAYSSLTLTLQEVD